MKKILANKKVAMIVAFQDFRDIEYFTPRDILISAGAEVITLSTKKGIARGADGGKLEINHSTDEFKFENVDGIVFIGGPGMVKELDNKNFQTIAKNAVSANKILGAICISPVILAKSGVLKDKKSTVWSNEFDKSAIHRLKESGAKYINEDVVVDGKIITASGPPAAEKFGKALVDALAYK